MIQPSKVVLVQERPEYSPSTNIPAVICHRCGALVLLMDRHSEWHISLTAAIQHLADGLIGLFATQPGGEELIAEVEAEQKASKEKRDA